MCNVKKTLKKFNVKYNVYSTKISTKSNLFIIKSIKTKLNYFYIKTKILPKVYSDVIHNIDNVYVDLN